MVHVPISDEILDEDLEDQITLRLEYFARLRAGDYRTQFDTLIEQAQRENNQYEREEGRWPRHPSGERPRRETKRKRQITSDECVYALRRAK